MNQVCCSRPSHVSSDTVHSSERNEDNVDHGACVRDGRLRQTGARRSGRTGVHSLRGCVGSLDRSMASVLNSVAPRRESVVGTGVSALISGVWGTVTKSSILQLFLRMVVFRVGNVL